MIYCVLYHKIYFLFSIICIVIVSTIFSNPPSGVPFTKVTKYFALILTGGLGLTSICMAVYFTISTFPDLLFIPRNFCSTRALTTKNVIFGVLEPNPLIPTNITSQLVPKIWCHAPGHCACRRPISSCRQSLHQLQTRHKSFHQKTTSLWMRCRRNGFPISSLWASLHQCITSYS